MSESKNSSLKIRKAIQSDIPAIMAIYDFARLFMAQNGNPTQWNVGYPSVELISSDIESGNAFVVLDEDSQVTAVFVFIIGPDPTYQEIRNGAWLNNDLYGTIHRLASSGRSRGVFTACLDYCLSLIGNIRIDTHANNLPMKKLIEKAGFVHCGIISVADGTERMAYQYTARKTETS